MIHSFQRVDKLSTDAQDVHTFRYFTQKNIALLPVEWHIPTTIQIDLLYNIANSVG